MVSSYISIEIYQRNRALTKKHYKFSKDKLSPHLCFEVPSRFIICIFHPETAFTEEHSVRVLRALLNAIKYVVDNEDEEMHVIFLGSNADSSGSILANIVKGFVMDDARFTYVINLARRHFVSLVKLAACVVGNSSAGILEVPAIKVPSVNVGNRQKGRQCPSSVIHVGVEYESIKNGVLQALVQDRSKIYSCYPTINTSEAIMSCLDKIDDFSTLLVKQFVPITPLPSAGKESLLNS